MIISIASGKGGTGKTLVATSLAVALEDREKIQLLDCDVEEPNAHIFLKPEITAGEDVLIPVPEVDKKKCTYCGRCAEICAYNVIAVIKNHVLVFPELCHGCGACSYLCPEEAISEKGRIAGSIEWGPSNGISFVHGRLAIGEAMAPPIVRMVKGRTDPDSIVIIDAPPGTSCPVVESVKGSDFCLLVTEPTPFGLNDLSLAVETISELGIPCGVIINRDCDDNEEIAGFCESKGIPVLLTIPLEREIAYLYSKGITLTEGKPEWKPVFIDLFGTIQETVNERTGCIKR